MPHPPQWLTSVLVLTHEPSQRVWPRAHRHVPASQVPPSPQLFPHPPQWSVLVFGSTQRKLQRI